MSRILVADDDPAQLQLRQLILEASGHQVELAVSAADARNRLAASTPDLLMMDLRFPNAEGEPDSNEGFGLIRYIREHAPNLPIIVLSACPQEIEDRPEERMVSRVLPKPCRFDLVLEAIRQLVPMLLCLAAFCGSVDAAPRSIPFQVLRGGEVIASLDMASPGSDWSQAGREAALADVILDGGKVQHVMLFAGARRHAYTAMLGTLEPGGHTLVIGRNVKYSAAGSGLEVYGASVREVSPGDPEWSVIANAPYLYARANTVGAFTDVPIAAYCERLGEGPAAILQYTVIFSNEDGGTSTRALMARWGRTTDIEYIYQGRVNSAGRVEGAIIQAKDHKDIPFDGAYEGTHPLLIPSTQNNMVSGQGTSPIRYQLVPALVDLSSHSREEVMDAQPLTYRIMAQELEREGKLRPPGMVDGEKISDPRNYLYIEVEMENQNAGLGILVHLKGEASWRASHLGRADYVLDRSGWARSTVELPPGTTAGDIAEVGFECLVPPSRPPALAGTCKVNSVSKSFFLTSGYYPGVSILELSQKFELATGQMRVFPLVGPHVARR